MCLFRHVIPRGVPTKIIESTRRLHAPGVALENRYSLNKNHSLNKDSQESTSAKKHGQWSSRNKKGTCPVLILATWSHTPESVKALQSKF